MFASPSPVDPAAPTSLSQYCPAPMIGESPTRPGIFHEQAARRGDGRKIALRRHGIAIDRSGLGDDEVIRIGDIQVVVGSG